MSDRHGDPEDLGSLAEEAGRFFEAFGEWTQHAAAERGAAAADVGAAWADQASALFHEINDHVATGDADCRFCPVCRGIHLVRELSPEVRDHLASAAASLMQAASGILQQVNAHPQDHHRQDSRSPREARGERIDVSDEDWPEE